MTNSKVSDLNQKKNSQQSGKDISRSPGSSDHKASNHQASVPKGQQHGQLGTDGDRQAKGGSGQHK